MDTTTQVWQGDLYLGRVSLTHEDWRYSDNWREAALKTAIRTFGPGYYYVCSEGPIFW